MILTSKVRDPEGIVAVALGQANIEYRGNLCTHITWIKGSRIRFVLRANNSRKYGARKSWSGRHSKAASWEAHRDFMVAIFEQDPNARLQTGMAVYRGKDGFEQLYPDTAYKNIGSQMQPMTMPDCSIEDTGWAI